MSPQLAAHDLTYCAASKPKHFAKFFLQSSALPERTHCQYIFLRDLGIVVLRPWTRWIAEHSIRVNLISRWSYIFQVINGIVGFISTFMIDLMMRRWNRADESCGHKAMYSEFAYISVPAKADSSISSMCSFTRQLSRWFSFSSIAPRSNSSNISLLTNFIYAFVIYDRLPYPHASIVRRMGLV